MTLTWPIALAVLVGALLHASWNALIKTSADKSLDTALIHALGSAIMLPGVVAIGPPQVAAWPYLFGSLVMHIGYYTALAGAYRHGDLGLTYPIMRGAAPLLVALGSGTLLGESLGLGAWIGVVGISAGVLLVGLSRSSFAKATLERVAHGHALRYAIANAAIIAIYTFIDGRGVRVSEDVLRYVAALFVLDGLPYFVLQMARRSADERRAAYAYMRRRAPIALLGSVASIGSYGIALWAMTRAPIALVAALRETSVLFAAVIGAWLLREPFGLQRAAGTVMIVGGVIALRIF